MTYVTYKRVAFGFCILVAILAGAFFFWPRDVIDKHFPLTREQAPNYHLLVSAKWVADLIHAKHPPTYQGKRYTILHVSTSDDKNYVEEHVPGAVLVRTNQIERGPTWNLVPDKKLQDVIEELGITTETTVIVYCEDPSAGARVLWALTYAGVQDVRLLDGGLRSWKRFGGTIETGRNRPKRVDFGGVVPLRRECLATLQEVKSGIADSKFLLVDVRSEAEHKGKTSGYDYISAKGRIPSSLWAGEINHLDDAEDVLEVKKRWTELGLTTDRPVVFYCGTGWRSALAFFYARLLGFKDVRNFDGSWLEWSADASRRNP